MCKKIKSILKKFLFVHYFFFFIYLVHMFIPTNEILLKVKSFLTKHFDGCMKEFLLFFFGMVINVIDNKTLVN